jgi:tetratricopeptide (TPR) repeat protein
MVEPEANRAGAPEQYEALRTEASDALYQGQLARAYELFDRAYGLAVADGDSNLIDLAYCNRAVVAARTGRARDMIPRLQEILLRTTDPQVARLSAYNLALVYDRPDGYRKSLFYARISLRYANELDDPAQRASSINQIGNILCAMSQFESALDHFRQAEEILADEVSPSKAIVLDNLGYCLTVLGEYDAAFDYLFRSLRMLRRLGAHLYETEPSLALCFAYLHIGRPDRAARHGARALDLAEEAADPKNAKLALLLLGEAYKMGGNLDVAHECFTLLQETFYPEMPEVPGMLFGLDVCKMINLRA